MTYDVVCGLSVFEACVMCVCDVRDVCDVL